MENKNNNEVKPIRFKKEKDRHIVAVPKSFIIFCLENTNSKAHKKELKRILENLS